jgi:2'-5' RNA ligase
MVRVFVALELSGGIREALERAQEMLRRCSARLTFVEPKNIHITVKFLGEVDESNLPAVVDALKKIDFHAFSVSAGQVTLNNPRQPRTAWCAIDDAGHGGELLRQIENALSPLGFERETRRFTPHATVARVKSPDPSLVSAIQRMSDTTYGSCTIRGMKLKKSTLTPLGPVYEDLLEVTW